ncbi:hypothetical protein MCUN1_000262 [Malassezia cuniculi]|uniref:ATP synthase subunit K, mitochondrial n=1 Tax=Malassezia cuniculi TaxID=948313 RepID=A0AAF0J5J0_9BASI|nr:hypothetical protein MCUN1_000262 [Malassezia cuniculi]
MSYTIAGKKVLSEHLVLGVFGAIGGGVFLATRGGGKEAKPAAAPAATSNADEEAFIKEFIAELQHEEKNAK